jgi:hypothetical protein
MGNLPYPPNGRMARNHVMQARDSSPNLADPVASGAAILHAIDVLEPELAQQLALSYPEPAPMKPPERVWQRLLRSLAADDGAN